MSFSINLQKTISSHGIPENALVPDNSTQSVNKTSKIWHGKENLIIIGVHHITRKL